MRVLIDACVLFPTVLRELVIGYAATGAFTPLWSPRILEEWQRAAARLGKRDAEIAGLEIAALQALFPASEVEPHSETEMRLSLPDADDVHVLAAAIDGHGDELLTLNTKDFPLRALAAQGVIRRHPDEFLLEAWHSNPTVMGSVVDDVLSRAGAHGIDVSDRRAILKRARLPRLGKALAQV